MSAEQKTAPATPKMTTYQNVRDAQKREEREHRICEGTGIAVARGGSVAEGETLIEIDKWPFVHVSTDTDILEVNVPAAVALAWLTPEDRAAIREALPADVAPDAPEVTEQVKAYNVWKWAIAHVTRTTEETLLDGLSRPMQSFSDKETHRKLNVPVNNYGKPILYEHSRPPSKGGDGSALHIHSFEVDGQRYSFFARGRKKWVYEGDTVSFDYVITDKGYRNVIRSSVITRDKKGKPVTRGDRRSKQVLRSAPTRMPGSRREQRD